MVVEKLPFAQSYRDLIVYQKARAAAKRIFDLTKQFPKEEMYSLTDQVRRSSRSMGGQIAEAWAKRRYPNHFVTKLTDADGEKNETQHWMDTAGDCGCLPPHVVTEVKTDLDEIGRMLQSMIDRAEDFRGDSTDRVREDAPSYGSIEQFFLNTEH
jgi:four helix bundle protein